MYSGFLYLFSTSEHFFHIISAIHVLWCKLCSELIISRNCTTSEVSISNVSFSNKIFLFFKLCLITFNNTILWLHWHCQYISDICLSLFTSPFSLDFLYPVILISPLQITWTYLLPSLFHSLTTFQFWIIYPPEKLCHLGEHHMVIFNWLVSLKI